MHSNLCRLDFIEQGPFARYMAQAPSGNSQIGVA